MKQENITGTFIGRQKNGLKFIITYNEGELDCEEWYEQKQEDIVAVDKWIAENVKKSSSRYKITSYGLKHLLQHETGVYLTNNCFKSFMLKNGHTPRNLELVNNTFDIKLPNHPKIDPNMLI